MDKREQTRKVRHIADEAERHLETLTACAEADLGTVNPDKVAEVAEYSVELARLAARNAVELATGGTPTCKRHADRAVAARNAAVDLAATVRRAVEAKRLRRVEAAHAKRTMLERDHPALAAVVACAPGDAELLDRAVALVRADDYRSVHRALDSFGVGADWGALTLPGGAELAAFITEDTDARELAGVIAAHVGRDHEENVALTEILDLAHAAGWRAPGVAFGDDPDHAAMLADWEPAAVYGGDDDHVVAEAAALAVARHGIFDDDHRPDDHDDEWWAWIVPGVPVWLPHVEAWREDMDYDSDTLTMRQMDRDHADWERWGQDDYLCAYAEAYAEAILDAETPPTVGEDEDSGIHPEDRAEQARERAQTIVDELDVGLSDVRLEESPLDPDEIAACARDDAQTDYRESRLSAARPEGMAPLF